MELNPLLMNAEDLLRYGNPKTDLELALFENLQEYFNKISLSTYDDLEQQIASLEMDLTSSEMFITELQFKISELEAEILVLEERD